MCSLELLNFYFIVTVCCTSFSKTSIVFFFLLLQFLFAGIGSFYFHATLSLLGQVVDEAGILWICCACAGVWMLDRNLPKYLQQNRYLVEKD